MEHSSNQFSLQPISTGNSDERIRPVSLPLDEPFIVGRSVDADWRIPDPAVSRRHASIARRGDSWLITDLSSRHGTRVNECRLEPNVPVPIEDGDVIAFGTWACRCTTGSARAAVVTSLAPVVDIPASVSAIPPQQLGGVAQRGLEVLMGLMAKLDAAGSREAVAAAAARAVRDATGCRRVVLVEPVSDTDLAVLASTTEHTPRLSRSLIDQASRHGLVQLMVDAEHINHAQSIMDLGIRSAICAPIMVDGLPAAFMMIDTRDTEGVVPSDAASFCQSVATLTGLAFQRISAASMAERHRQLQSDLDAARRAQEFLSPPKEGGYGAVAYRFESIPGRVVAGDLFDIFALDATRTAFFLGDVSGKGVGAAMLMAACQSQLRTQLLSRSDLEGAMAAVNADLHQRSDSSKFVTLVAGVIDAGQHTVQLVDAGHGLCAHVSERDGAVRVEATPGYPLGVVDEAEYEVMHLSLAPGSSLVIFSDGAVEQPDHTGAQYGFDGVLKCLAHGGKCDELVARVLAGVRAHAAGPLADDLTVAAVWIEQAE